MPSRAHAREGGALLLTTHHLDEAEALAGRVVLIEGGRVASDGPLSELKTAAGLTLVRFRAEADVRIEGAERDGETLRLLVLDAGAAVERLVRAGIPLPGLEVRPLTLEEALSSRSTLR